ncbi:aldehyde dehydrogenase family protein, partial [Rhizobium ruizarguesonis]
RAERKHEREIEGRDHADDTGAARTPISGGIIIARIFEEAGLPTGVLQMAPGGADNGEAMCTDAR